MSRDIGGRTVIGPVRSWLSSYPEMRFTHFLKLIHSSSLAFSDQLQGKSLLARKPRVFLSVAARMIALRGRSTLRIPPMGVAFPSPHSHINAL
jgi:hypothetical protein